jgi:hypothetical protein
MSIPFDLKSKHQKIQKHLFVSKDPYLRNCPTANCDGIMVIIKD